MRSDRKTAAARIALAGAIPLALMQSQFARGQDDWNADERAAGYGDEATSCLRRAVELGFDDAEELETNEELAPLRDRPDFQALVDSLR